MSRTGQQERKGGNKRAVVPFGRYLLLERISVGGMAEVFKAKAFGIGGFEKIVAIKRILPTIAEDKQFIEMFIDEAKIVGQLNHANICQVFELGKIGDSHFIAMEFIWGKDLLQIQNRFRKLRQIMPIPMAAYIMSKVLEGLDYAHKKTDDQGRPLNIIHRDVSPQNILISYEGAIKLIDFGIAKAAYRQTRTQAGILKGKFGYMSPEQVRGLPIDHRSDIFAAGTVLYELITGEKLFYGESDFSTLEKVRKAEVIPPSRLNSKIPKELEEIVMKALAREPEDRWQWASEMQEALHYLLINMKPIFTAQKLSEWMKTNFAAEIRREKARMEEYAKLTKDVLDKAIEYAKQGKPYLVDFDQLTRQEPLPEDSEEIDVNNLIEEIEDVTEEGGGEGEKTVLSESPFIDEFEEQLKNINEQPTTIFYASADASTSIDEPIAEQPTRIFAEENIEKQIAEEKTRILPESTVYPEPLLPPKEASTLPIPPIGEPALTPNYPLNQLDQFKLGIRGEEGKYPQEPSFQQLIPKTENRWKWLAVIIGVVIIILGGTTIGIWALIFKEKRGGNLLQGTVINIKSQDIIGAEVYINGVKYGITPISINKLPPGIYDILVKKENYKPFSAKVTLHPNETLNIDALLTYIPQTAKLKLQISPEPKDLLISINNDVIDYESTKTGLNLEPNQEYTIRLVAKNFQQKVVKIKLEPGEERIENIELIPLKGTITVDSVFNPAKVYLDGKIVADQTPTTITDLEFNKTYHVKVTYKDQKWEEKVKVVPESPLINLIAQFEKKEEAPSSQKEGQTKGEEKTKEEKIHKKEEPTKVALADQIKLEKTKPNKENKKDEQKQSIDDMEKQVQKEKEKPSPETKGKGEGGKGCLAVNSIPVGAEVVLDGIKTGRKTPILPTKCIKTSPGSHKITLILDGKDYNFSVDVKSEGTTVFVQKLQ